LVPGLVRLDLQSKKYRSFFVLSDFDLFTKRFKGYPINRVSSGLQVFGFFGCEAYQRRTERAGVVPHQPRSSLANAHRISCVSNSDFLNKAGRIVDQPHFFARRTGTTSKLGSAFKSLLSQQTFNFSSVIIHNCRARD